MDWEVDSELQGNSVWVCEEFAPVEEICNGVFDAAAVQEGSWDLDESLSNIEDSILVVLILEV